MFNPSYGFDPRMRARGLHAAAPMRFDEYYRCYPVAMAPGPERPELNYGSKILLPPSALDKVSRLHVQWPLLMELVNAEQDTHSHCGVLEFVAEEGRAYLPHWMMQTLRLDVGDMLQVKTTALPLARLVRLQPQSPAFLDISDPKAVLERVFRNFAALTQGDVFRFAYNGDEYAVAVLAVEPASDRMGVSMLETDVSVDFAAPVGYVEPSKTKSVSSGTSTPRTGGRTTGAVPPGGALHIQGSMAQAINYEAIAPGSALHTGTPFVGEGHRVGKKAKGKGAATAGPGTGDAAAAPAAPAAGTSGSSAAGAAAAATAAAARTQRRRSGPQPLRLGPNKLFFGYHIRPVKTKEQKDEEAQRPRFAGQGHSLRAAKKKDEGA